MIFCKQTGHFTRSITQIKPEPSQPPGAETHRNILRWTLLTLFCGVSFALVVNVADSTLLKVPILVVGSAGLLLVLSHLWLKLGSLELSFSWVGILLAAYIAASVASLLMAPDLPLGIEAICILLCYLVLIATVVFPSLEAGVEGLSELSTARMLSMFVVVAWPPVHVMIVPC